MILFDKLYLDEELKVKRNFIHNILEGNLGKNYFVLLYDFKSSETFDIICTSHLPSLKNKEQLVLVGVAKTKPVALQLVLQFFQDIINKGVDLMEFDFDEYIMSNSNKE